MSRSRTVQTADRTRVTPRGVVAELRTVAPPVDGNRTAPVYLWSVGLDPVDLYELTGESGDDAGDGDGAALERPVLLQALDGFVDAGSAVQLAREHIMSTMDTKLVARFDIDQLLDYRSRRPTMRFVEDHWESYEEPVLGLYR